MFLFVSWQVSYSLLARVSPVTHSVTNSLKRVVVIVSSVLFFRTPLLPCLRHVTLKLMLCFMHVPITHHLIYLYLNCIVVLACRNWYCSCWSLIRAAFSLKCLIQFDSQPWALMTAVCYHVNLMELWVWILFCTPEATELKSLAPSSCLYSDYIGLKCTYYQWLY